MWAVVRREAVFQERNHPAFTRPENQQEVTYQEEDLPVSENPREDLFTIPVFTRPDKALLDQYIEAFRKVATHVAELV